MLLKLGQSRAWWVTWLVYRLKLFSTWVTRSIDKQALSILFLFCWFWFRFLPLVLVRFTSVYFAAGTVAHKMPREKCCFSIHDGIYPGLSFHWVRKDSWPFQEYRQGRLLLSVISIITQVIIEILALSLAENGVIFRYNHLRRGDYSGRTNFQNSRLALCQCIGRGN